jgi:hypothetical protein
MNTFTLVQRALDATLDDPEKMGLDEGTIETGRILGAVQTVVDALTPPDGGRYIVGFADITTASTSLGERRITVSSKPLRDPALSLVEKAVVIATFAAHEIGHTFVTQPRKGLVMDHNRHTGYHAVANLADDIILEPVMIDRYPILADAFRFTGEWVLRATAKDLPLRERMSKAMTTPDRFNILLTATRYGDIPEIIWVDGVTRAERDWSRLWADRLISARLDDHATFLATVDEAWDRIRSEADEDETEPEPPTGNGGDDPDEDEPEDDDAEDDEQDPDEGEPDEDGDETEPGTERGKGGKGEPEPGEQDPNPDWDDDESDEDEDGDGSGGEGDDDEDDEAEDDESEDGESEGEGEGEDGDEPGQPEPVDGDAPGEVDGEPGDGINGGGGNPYTDGLRSEDDWDDAKVEKSTHDSAEHDPYDYDSARAEAAVRSFASTTVTAFGKHGSFSTTWE